MNGKRPFVFALALTMALAAGCQATPEEPIVSGKSSDALIERAAEQTAGTLAERVAAPERYTGSAASAGGEMTVTIDAAVTVPEADQAPIWRVVPANITQEQVDVLMDMLVQGELYDYDLPKSKQELTEELLQLKQEQAQGPSEEDAGAVWVTEDGALGWEEYIQQRIDQLQEEIAKAPETVTPTVSTGQFQVYTDDGFMRAGGENTTDEYGWEALMAEAGEGMEYNSRASYVRAPERGFFLSYVTADNTEDLPYTYELDVSKIPDIAVTQKQAQALCEPVVEALGMADMRLYSAVKKYGGGPNAPRCCWELEYTRCLEGIPIAYSSVEPGYIGTYEGDPENFEFKPPWDNEKLMFLVNDEGIVGMKWNCPYTIQETVTEDAALLPFDDIMDIFEKMFVVENDGKSLDATVDSVRLSYMRVSEQNKSYTGLLVPVWDFYGTEQRHMDNGESYTSRDPDRSLMTINAVDGTVIDRAMGY